MAQEFVKRVAQVFIDDKQAQPSLKSLTAESKKLNAELARMAPNTKDFAEASKRLQGVNGRIADIRSAIKGTDGVFGQLKANIGPLGGMMAGVFGGAALLGAAKKSIDAFHESEKAVAQVGQALQNMGAKAGVSLDELTASATALESTSLFSDEEILTQATTQLINFGTIAGDNLMRAQGAAVDMAAAMNGDLQGATMALGKALNDPVQGLTALGRAGVKFTEDQKAMIETMAKTGDVAGAQAEILKLVEQRFKGQAAAQAEAMGGMRELQVAFDQLTEQAGGMLSDALNDVTSGLADLVVTGMDWLGLTEKQSDKVQEQRIEMNALFNVLRAGNITAEQRVELVNKLNTEYSAFLPTAVDVNATEEELARLQRDTNKAMLERIELLAKQELLQEAADKLKEAQKDQMRTQLDLERSMQGGATTYEKLKASVTGGINPTVMFAQANVRAMADAKEAEKAYATLAARLTDVAKASNEASGAGGAAGVAAPSEEQLAAVREALNQAYATMRQDRLSGMDKELADVDAWRDELLKKAEGSDNDQIMVYQAAQDRREAIRQKYAGQAAEKAAADLKKLNETLDGIQQEHELAQLDQDQREVAKVEEKYAKLRAAAKGHAKELAAIEQLEAEELAMVRADQDLRQQAAADAVAASVEQERLNNVNTRLTTMQAEHQLELQAMEQQGQDVTDLLRRQAEERAPLEEELRQAQLDSLNAHYEDLYAQAEAAGQSTEELQRLHGEAIQLINAGTQAQTEESQAQHDARMLAMQAKRAQAQQSIANSVVSAIGSLLQLSANNEEKFAEFNKVVALAQLAVDTAKAISGITAAVAADPTSITPIERIVKIAAGVAAVLANIAKAKQLLSTAATPKAPSFEVAPGAAPAGQATPQEFAAGGYTSHATGGWVRGPKLGLIGEAGTEHVSPYWMVSHPNLQPVYNWLEAVRTTKQVPAAFAQGGFSTSSRGTALVNATAPTGPDMGLLVQTISMLNNTLSKGIDSRITYDQVKDSSDRMNTIESESQLT